MASTIAVKSGENSAETIAPWWHTVLVLAILGGCSFAGFYQHGFPNLNLPAMNSRLSGYFTVIALEWVLVLLIWLALCRHGLTLDSLVAGSWRTTGNFFRDLGLGIALIVVVVPLTSGINHLLGVHTAKTLATLMLPKTGFELFVWLALAWTAGFCEELVFRGYLMRQFGSWTGSRAAGLILQGVAFGLAHGYQGMAMLTIMAEGWVLGLLASWRKSLRPGMLSHGVQDSLGSIVAFVMMR
jgi:membrane protease YdiL (CAAX protease family)